MADETADQLTPADQIVAEAEAGELDPEHAMLRLLAEIANAVWMLSADMDEFISAARAAAVPRDGTVH